MLIMKNEVQTYAWGSRHAIARLQHRPVPSPQPEAELWLGAHPLAPSQVAPAESADYRPLNELIARDPTGMLGATNAARFGHRLPYLMKILAAEQPLSVQVHPDAEQARRGFQAEEEAGVARNAPERSYVDPYHKPELIVALDRSDGPFDALYGFQHPDKSAEAFAALGLAELDPVVAALRGDGDGPRLPALGERLRAAVQILLAWPPPQRPALVAAVADRSQSDLPGRLAEQYPGDIGVLIAMLLNRVRLAPGEALFTPAGCPHAYLRGVGVEIMAASDNVLRCGLTPKRVDQAEAARLLKYQVLADPVLRPQPHGPGLVSWPVPVPDFSLIRAEIGPASGAVTLPGAGPRIAVCVQGIAHLSCGESQLLLRPGESAFLAASEPAATATAPEPAVIFQAAPGR